VGRSGSFRGPWEPIQGLGSGGGWAEGGARRGAWATVLMACDGEVWHTSRGRACPLFIGEQGGRGGGGTAWARQQLGRELSSAVAGRARVTRRAAEMPGRVVVGC
jgi:hypothetical protein